MDKRKVEKIIKLALIKIGFRCDLAGFNYLCSAIMLVLDTPELGHRLCKGLYVELSVLYEKETSHGIERNIRHSIENTFINKSFAELNRIFKAHLYTIDEKPTVGELITLMTEYINLGLYKEHLGID